MSVSVSDEVVRDVFSKVRELFQGYAFDEGDIQRVIYWSWCTIEDYEQRLRTDLQYTDEDISEDKEDTYGDATHVLTLVIECTVGRDEGEPYEYIELVDGDHIFVRIESDGSHEITYDNDGNQPDYYGGPRDKAREWVSKYGELQVCVYASDDAWQ